MSKKPVVLMILDGYGLNKTHEGNAVYEAKKPVMDRLMKECPFVELSLIHISEPTRH
mgnify:CR=1 FL=1